jgi:hypothetical protein
MRNLTLSLVFGSLAVGCAVDKGIDTGTDGNDLYLICLTKTTVNPLPRTQE